MKDPRVPSFRATSHSTYRIELNVCVFSSFCLQVNDIIITQSIACFFHLPCHATNHQQEVPSNTTFNSDRPLDSANTALSLHSMYG